ncbi:sodium channel modifier 1 isoform X2 [Aplysia californica]|uniref:Sodium channel modifier 1 n=1 Tax=Aplysia californica TaxID=6500 RepID=A0ABM0JUS0_APLCA|nr:sodium channel modifier 1 isoform X2 [Aplysia californica]
MSFKREGNDTHLLDTLRKRRIKDLFSEDIPEDEAKLLCNGRFTCMVCPSRPIFDTVCMLGVHRKGKKHLQCQEVHEAKKKELKHLIAARKHEQYLKDGTTSIKMAASTGGGFSKSAPYDPRVRKKYVKHGERKPRVDLSELDVSDTQQSCISHRMADRQTRDTSTWRDLCQQQAEGPVQHDKQLKNIFKQKISDPVRVTPYQSMSGRSKSRSGHHRLGESSTGTLPPQSSMCPVNQYASGYSDSNFNSPVAPYHSEPLMAQNRLTMLSCSSVSATLYQAQNYATIPLEQFTSTPNASGTSDLTSWSVQSPAETTRVGTTGQGQRGDSNLNGKASTTSTSARLQAQGSHNPGSGSGPQPPANRELVEKYRLLQGSGWKRDWDGKWIKDENAEFDSDEEPPDVP